MLLAQGVVLFACLFSPKPELISTIRAIEYGAVPIYHDISGAVFNMLKTRSGAVHKANAAVSGSLN